MRHRVAIRAAVAAAMLTVSALTASAAMSPVVSARMTGKAEAPKKGEENGSGFAVIRLNAAKGTVCWEFKNVKGVAKPNAAHIHKAPKGKAGPVVVPFGATYKAKGCTKATKAIITAIESHPGAYYVNIHNAEYPGGAIRGQLVRGAAG
jgi:CHRD domain